MGRLTGKYALITGATSGIGLETARQFIAEGATVAITGRSEQGLLEAKKTLGDVQLIQSDAVISAGNALSLSNLRLYGPGLMCYISMRVMSLTTLWKSGMNNPTTS